MRNLSWIIIPFVAMLCVIPWTIRNYRVHGDFLLVSSNGGFNFWRGSLPANKLQPPPFWETMDQYVPAQDLDAFLSMSETEKDRFFYRLGWKVIENDPAGYAIRVLSKMLFFWNPVPDPGFHGKYIAVAGGSIIIIVFVLAFLGILTGKKSWNSIRLFLFLFLPITIVHGIYLNNLRLRYPVIDPWLLVLASSYCSRFREK